MGGGPKADTTIGISPPGERRRKLIHLSTSAAALLVWFFPRPAALVILGTAVAASLGIEWGRANLRSVRYRFLRHTRLMLRQVERRRLSGATWLAIGYFLTTLLFPKAIASTAILYGAVGDPVAGVVGKGFGRHQTSTGKSWEGFLAGAVTNFLIGIAIPGIGYRAAAVGAVAAATFEFLPGRIDDNIRTTVGGGASLWFVTGVLG